MAIFGHFFASCVSASRVQQVSDLHLKFALRPHHVWMADIQSAARKKRRKKKEEELEMWASPQRDGRPAEYRWRPLFNATKFGFAHY